MKKKALVITLASMIAFGVQAGGEQSHYVYGGYSSFSGNTSDYLSGNGYQAIYGKDFSDYFGLEVSGSYHDFDSSNYIASISGDNYVANISPTVFINLTPNVRVFSKFGYAYDKSSMKICNKIGTPKKCINEDKSDSGLTYGLGIEGHVSSGWATRISYDKYTTKNHWDSINLLVGYRF